MFIYLFYSFSIHAIYLCMYIINICNFICMNLICTFIYQLQ
ncbi:hypothetical protein F383_37356 [Gossypium arboreum]|uniref:Uncharacterized protein n=1 Tax=Gossypium arboreum TaxID=29729 RepID=A0A0B0NCN0_GOSAR|nr:hypothetical protein F383_37356 [Gossypium arboreum]